MTCGSVHPEDPSRRCLLPPTAADHADGLGAWPNVEVQQGMALRRTQKIDGKRKKKGTRSPAMTAIAAAVVVARREFNGQTEAPTRHTDPQTSVDAAASVGSLKDNQAEVLLLLCDYGPMSHGQLIEAAAERGVKQSESGLRTRCDELAKIGLVVDSGQRAKTEHGRDTIVWAAVSLTGEVE